MTTEARNEELGETRLTLVHAIGQSMAVGPVLGVGVVSGLVAGVAGFDSPLSVVIATVGCFCLAYVIAFFARRFSGAGAMYEYLVHGANPLAGALGAALYVTGVLALMGIWIALGFLAQNFFAVHLSLNVTWWVWGALALIIACGLNHLGVRPAVRGVLALALLSMIPFLILAISIIVQGGAAGNTLSVFTTSHTSLNSVFKGVLFAVTLFIGFEASAALGEECEDPHRQIPIALMGSVVLAGLFYLVVVYAAAIGFGVSGSAHVWAASSSPMGVLAQRYDGKGLATIVDAVVLLDGVSVAIAFVVAVTRVVFSVARDGLLPRALATRTRHGTPLGANLLFVVVGVVALVFGGVTHYGNSIHVPNNIEAFSILGTTGSLLIEAVYALLAIAAIRLIWLSGGAARLRRIPIALVALATTVLAYKGTLDPWPKYPANRGVIFAAIWVILIAVWLGYLHFRYPERLAAAGRQSAGVAVERSRISPEPGAISPT